MDITGIKYFDFLATQISEGSIVEDELEIARLAVLVPELCAALRQTLAFTDVGAAVLAKAMAVIDEIVGGQIEAAG